MSVRDEPARDSRCRADFVLYGAGQLVTCDPARSGLGVIEEGALAARGGRIVWVGPERELQAEVELESGGRSLNAGGRVVMPGIVECHSHLVFGGSRAAEFQMRVAGRSYEEIAAAGGGIMSTVAATRQAGDEELLAAARRHLDWMLSFGMTTVETKSGYGLTVKDELRILRVVRELERETPVRLVSTFLGAHTVPAEYRENPDAYVDLVVEEMLPRVADEGLARFCDVFCEIVAFDLSQSRKVLEAALDLGFKLKLHADQLSAGGGAQLAADLGAVSADHLDRIDGSGVEALARAGITAVLLPGAVFFLGLKEYAPARRLREAGVEIALSTDFNPGTSYSENPFLMGTIASIYMGMSAEEVILGLTRRAAGALDLENEVGSLQSGLAADLVVLDTRDYLTLPYHFGVNPVAVVIKNGRIVKKGGEERAEL
ncbi:MAG: imidazolonepropionase [Thermoleophilia bacterium]